MRGSKLTCFALTTSLGLASPAAAGSPGDEPPQAAVETLHVFKTAAAYTLGGGLVEAPDGSLYGVTESARGRRGLGVIYRITPDGRTTIVHNFSGHDGSIATGDVPDYAMSIDTDGGVLGVTFNGGPGWNDGGGCGTVFRLGPSGGFEVLHGFAGRGIGDTSEPGGCHPSGGLVEGDDGWWYGATAYGGVPGPFSRGCGTIFRVDATGRFETRHRFTYGDGCHPIGLIRAGEEVYGVTDFGGPSTCPDYYGTNVGCGTVFRMAPDGAPVTTVHAFTSVGGELPTPSHPVYHPADGALFGTIRSRGEPCVYVGEKATVYMACLAVFRLGLGGEFSVLHAFDDGVEYGPHDIVIGDDGSIYGVTYRFEPCGDDCGTLFQLTLSGRLTALHEFGFGRVPETLERGRYGDYFGTTGSYFGCRAFGCDSVYRLGLLDTDRAPNLKTRGFSAPNGAPSGAAITLRDTVGNIGLGLAAASSTTFWLSSTNTMHGAVAIGSRPVSPLAAGAKSAGATEVQLPALTPGVYSLFAFADGGWAVPESLEFDNVKRRDLVIGPNLVVKKMGYGGDPGIVVETPNPVASEPVRISVYTANIGGDGAPVSVTRLYRSARGRLDDAVLLAEFQAGEHAGPDPGEHDHDSVSTLLPAGEYYLLAEADALHQVAEAVENNVAKLRIVVR